MAFPDLLAAADRAALQHLGGPVRYTPSPINGDAVDVTGIFDAAAVHQDVGQAGLVSQGPQVFLRLADLPVDPEDDDPTVVVAGNEYRVREVQKDGQGGVLLLLHRTGA